MEKVKFYADGNKLHIEDTLQAFANSPEPFVEVEHRYHKSANALSSIKKSIITYCLDSRISCCMRKDKVYLVKNKAMKDFTETHPCGIRGRYVKKVDTVVTPTTPVKKEVGTKQFTNSEVFNTITKLWDIAKQMEGSNLNNFNDTIYFDLIEDYIKRVVTSDLAKSNFMDYVQLACKDDELFYVINLAVI